MPCYRPELGRNELAAPTIDDLWTNRLVYFLREYYLADFNDGREAAGALEIQTTYPNVCIKWTPWMDCQRNRVTTLLASHQQTEWWDVQRSSEGGQECGAMWRNEKVPPPWATKMMGVGTGANTLFNPYQGNGRREGRMPTRAAEPQPPSLKTSKKEPPTSPPEVEDNDPGGSAA